MQVLTSTEPAFRYRCRWTADGPLPDHLAATRVLVFEFDPLAELHRLEPVFEVLKARSAECGPAAHCQALELAEADAVSRRVGRLLREAGVPSFPCMDDLEPVAALVKDRTPFHDDNPLWGLVQGAWCLSGPRRQLSFPMMGLVVPFRPGTFVLFDSAQPHGLLREGETRFAPPEVQDTESVCLLSFSAVRAGTLAYLLGAECYSPHLHSALPQTSEPYSVCAYSGLVPLVKAFPGAG